MTIQTNTTFGIWLIIGLMLSGCGSNDTNVTDTEKRPEDTGDRTTDNDTESSSESSSSFPASDAGEPVAFDHFGELSTIAGTCTIEDKGVNGWKPSFEGEPAVQAELSRPHFAMADDAGNIFIADKDAQAIRKITVDGNIVTVAGTNVDGDSGDGPGAGTEMMLSSPNGLWVRGDGTVYILDLGSSKVRRLTPEGEMTTLFTDSSGFGLGRGLWLNDDETLCYYASGSMVKKWTPEEGITVFASGFSALGMVVVDPDGHVVVADRGYNRVFRIEADGSNMPIAGTGGTTQTGGSGFLALDTALEGVRGVWFLENGDYFVATHEGSQVWYVDPLGVIYLFLDGLPNDVHAGDGEPFDSPGPKVSEVRGISVDHFGNVIITENDCGYIRMVSSEPAL